MQQKNKEKIFETFQPFMNQILKILEISEDKFDT